MANQRLVKLQSTVNAQVGVCKKDYGVRRIWKTKGQIIPLPYETVEQMLWDSGFRAMIDRGILYIPDMQDKIDLGLEDPGTKEPTNIKVLNDNQILALLKTKTYDDFVKEVNDLNKTQVDAIVNYAIANKIVDVNKCSYLKDMTGMDIMKAVAQNLDFEKIDAAEAKKQAANNERY